MPVNPNDAPPGCFAVADESPFACKNCCMAIKEAEFLCSLSGDLFSCGLKRGDGQIVRYEHHRGGATASWPHDDMGTPV